MKHTVEAWNLVNKLIREMGPAPRFLTLDKTELVRDLEAVRFKLTEALEKDREWRNVFPHDAPTIARRMVEDRAKAEQATTIAKGAFVDVLFDAPPGHEPGRFIDCVDENGKGLNAGAWMDNGDGTWALRIPTGREKLTSVDQLDDAPCNAYSDWGVGEENQRVTCREVGPHDVHKGTLPNGGEVTWDMRGQS